MKNATESAGEFLRGLFDMMESKDAAMQEFHHQMKENGLLSRITLHKFICSKGCQVATVFQAGDQILCAVRDYKLAPGFNEQESTPAARAKNTLDGDRHWPAHVFDVDQMARFGEQAGMHLVCRHRQRNVRARDILGLVSEAKPGHPGPPSEI